MRVVGRKRKGSDSGVAPVIAVVVVGLLTAAMAAGLYAFVTKFRGDGDQAVSASFVATRNGCRAEVMVVAAMKPIDLSRLTIQPLDGQPGFTVTLANRSAHDSPWVGAAGDGVLGAGQTFEVWSAMPRAFLVLDHAAGSAVGQFQAPSMTPDPGATVRVDPANGTPTQLSGVVNDACSGVGAVALQLVDATTGMPWNGASFAVGTPASLSATLASPGATTSTWSLDVSTIPWSPGHNYSIQATPSAEAGASGATLSSPVGQGAGSGPGASQAPSEGAANGPSPDATSGGAACNAAPSAGTDRAGADHPDDNETRAAGNETDSHPPDNESDSHAREDAANRSQDGRVDTAHNETEGASAEGDASSKSDHGADQASATPSCSTPADEHGATSSPETDHQHDNETEHDHPDNETELEPRDNETESGHSDNETERADDVNATEPQGPSQPPTPDSHDGGSRGSADASSGPACKDGSQDPPGHRDDGSGSGRTSGASGGAGSSGRPANGSGS